MSRYTGAKLRITRKLGFLRGFVKSKKSKRLSPYPGQHCHKAGRKMTEYGKRLKEKQRVMYNYGLRERQLQYYVKQAQKLRGPTGPLILRLLEMRLDSVVFRSGLVKTIPSARQLITHKHVQVNGSYINVPSYPCRTSDVVGVCTKVLENIAHFPIEKQPHSQFSIIRVSDIPSAEIKVDQALVTEFYSRKIL
jgi:small subunit ribosomal protein S4